MELKTAIQHYLAKESETLLQLDVTAIESAVRLLLQVRENGGTVYTLGNGGSAATASHFVCDFSKGATEQLGGKPFHFVCLADNAALFSAIANDIAYEEVFRFQLRNCLTPDDALLAISGSGNSSNVLRAAEYAKGMRVPVIALTGYDGGKLRMLADISLHVPVNDMQLTEDVHMIIDHLMLHVLCDCLPREA